MAAFNPRVAFGIYALSVAMAAKAEQLDRAPAEALRAAFALRMPDDDAAAQFVAAFLDAVDDDPIAAGAALHDALTSWTSADGAPALTAVCGSWQERADCGHG